MSLKVMGEYVILTGDDLFI